jgi:hypothetical protein
VLMLMARHVLGGPTDEGRASYQIALSVCPECQKGAQLASGELVPVGAEMVAMADCDGQYLELPAVPTVNGNAHPNESAHTGARAKQTVPPAMRRAVLRRDHRRCVVPGCRNVLFLDLHHIDLRSEGGPNQQDNLITLCGAHHRAAHYGRLTVTGCVSAGVCFAHADGSSYGQVLQPRRVETQARAFSALRGLGFREGEIRRVLAELSETEDSRDADTERLLRAALTKLT